MARSRRLAAVLVVLTSFGCSTVPVHVTLPQLAIGEPAFAATVVAYTSAPVLGGNRLDILLNGDEVFPAKIAAIRAARKNINYAQYVFEEGEPAVNVAQALAERCRAGIQVNVLVDAVGSVSMPTEYRQILTEAGCRLETYRPLRPLSLDRANYRNHRRILVVDGLVGMTGGSGTSGKWGGNGREEGHWRDTDVRIEGPVVQQLQGAFADNWLEATGVVLGGADYFPRSEHAGPIAAQIVRSSPAGGSTAMYTMFLLAMAAARQSVYITNPYFVPDEKMVETLAETARRGVRVVLLMPGAIDHNIVRQASRSELGRLMQAGVEVHEYRPSRLHAKTMVVDGVWSTIGSTNLDRRSFALNEELNLVVYDREFARRLEEIFERDLGESRPVTYQAWRNRGIMSRMLELLSLPIRDQL